MADDDDSVYRVSVSSRKYQREVEQLTRMVNTRRESLNQRRSGQGKTTYSTKGAAESEKAMSGRNRGVSATSRRLTALSDAQIDAYSDRMSTPDRCSTGYSGRIGDYAMQYGTVSEDKMSARDYSEREDSAVGETGERDKYYKPQEDGERRGISERCMAESKLKYTSNLTGTYKVTSEKQPADNKPKDYKAWRMRLHTKTEGHHPKKALPDVVGTRDEERIVRQFFIHLELSPKKESGLGDREQPEVDYASKMRTEVRGSGKPPSGIDGKPPSGIDAKPKTIAAAAVKTTGLVQHSKASFPSNLQRKQSQSASKVIPFGGKCHRYVPEKKCTNSIYQSRRQEQREKVERKTKVLDYESKVCLHCFGVYPDGKCRPSKNCKNLRDKVDCHKKRSKRRNSMADLIGEKRGGYYFLGQTYMPSAPTCSSAELTEKINTCTAKVVPESPKRYNYLSLSSSSSSSSSSDTSSCSSSYFFDSSDEYDESDTSNCTTETEEMLLHTEKPAIGFEDPEKVMCKVTVTKRALIPENINRIRLMIVEVDILNKPPVIRSASSCSSIYADSYTDQTVEHLEDISLGFVDSSNRRTPAKGRQKSVTLPKLSSAENAASGSVTIHGHPVQATIGRLRQFLKIDIQDATISLREAKMKRNLKDMYGIGKSKTTALPPSGKSTYFGCPAILKFRLLMDACFSLSEPTKLVTLHSRADLDPTNLRAMLICRWNTEDLSTPTHILTGFGKMHRICFGPFSAEMVFSCMDDGSVAVWDLEEPNSMHCICRVKGDDAVLRYPTFCTPHGDDSPGHASPALAIVALNPYAVKNKCPKKIPTMTNASMPFQVVTMEEAGVLIFWQVERVPHHELSLDIGYLGQENPQRKDHLIMAMNLRISLTREFPILRPVSLGTLVLRINHIDTDGIASAFWTELLCRRLQQARPSPQPQVYVGTSLGEMSLVQCLDFSPFLCNYFLAGYEDGRVFLCHTERNKPIMYFNHPQGLKKPVIKVMWSPFRPVVFYVFFKDSGLSIYDLLESTSQPVQTLVMDKEPTFHVALSPDTSSLSTPNARAQQRPCVLMAGAGGTMLLKEVNKTFLQQRGQRDINFLERLGKEH